jgi:hypothetical protein
MLHEKLYTAKNVQIFPTVIILFYLIYIPYIIDLFMLMLQLLTIISSIDDQNYPEKSHTYYIVNAPYIFSACWKVSYFCYQKMEEKMFLWLDFLRDIFI